MRSRCAAMKKRILLVDEDQDVLDLLKFNLEAEGYEVVTARDGRQALARLHNRTDLIILEEKLPDKSGWEVLQLLRSQNVAKDIPALFLTTAPLNPDIVAQRSPATLAYLVKPVSMRALLERVKTILAEAS